MDIRTILAQNLKTARQTLQITRVKLAEQAGISAPYLADIERCRTWVSDKTLISLSNALGIEVFQLFTPATEEEKHERRPLPSHWLLKLRQDMKEDINAHVDMHFERLFSMTLHD